MVSAGTAGTHATKESGMRETITLYYHSRWEGVARRKSDKAMNKMVRKGWRVVGVSTGISHSRRKRVVVAVTYQRG